MVNVLRHRANGYPGMAGYDPDLTLEMEGWEFVYNGITGDMDWYTPHGEWVDSQDWDKLIPEHVAKVIGQKWSEIVRQYE